MCSWAISLHHHVLLAALLMSRPQGGGPPPFAYGLPQRPSDVAVATSPPSTTDASDNSAATTASSAQLVSATTAAQIQYPLGFLTINNIDSVVVQYDTTWTGVTLGVVCSGDGVGGTKSFDLSLASANGQYTLEPVEKEIVVSEYPISCYLMLRDDDSIANFVVGGTLDIVSTAGVATTYAQSTTKAAQAERTGTATNTNGAADSSATSTSADSSPDASTKPTATSTGTAGTSSTSEEGTSSSSGSSSGTSPGAKAGIAIGVLLAIGLILFAVWFFYRQRRRMRGVENELEETKRQHQNERAYVDGILKVAGKPDTRNGGKVVMAETPNRGSGEWKKFFNARAASATGGGGSAPPSRLGTAMADTSALPQLPDDGRSTPGGDAASTTGLVRK